MNIKFYRNRDYLDYIFTYQEKIAPWKADQIIRIIERNSLQPKNISEYFCGLGEILNILSDRFDTSINYFGYETSEQALLKCSDKSKNKLSFSLKDLDDISTETKHDIVLAIDIIEHIENYFDFLRLIKNKAEYKIFHIPLDMSAQNVIRSKPLVSERKSVGHMHYFTKATALETLKDADYEIIDHFYTKACFELPQSKMGNILKIPRKLLFSINEDLASNTLGGFSLLVLAK